jgi:hypothetical protein
MLLELFGDGAVKVVTVCNCYVKYSSLMVLSSMTMSGLLFDQLSWICQSKVDSWSSLAPIAAHVYDMALVVLLRGHI